MLLVSIIIPVFNVGPYIGKCLQSVIDQTYKNLEVIIVDDCGTDNSMRIVEQMVIENHDRMQYKILHHAKNRGLSAARNTGIEEASGEYVYLLDSDDYISSDCIEQMVGRVCQYPKTEIVFSGTVMTNNEYTWFDYTQKKLPDYSENADWIQLQMLRRTPLGMTAWNKLYSKTFIDKYQFRFEEGLIYEDELWNLQLSQHIEFASFLHINTYTYCVRQDGISKKTNYKVYLILWNSMMRCVAGRNKNLQNIELFYFIYRTTKKYFRRVERFPSFLILSRLALRAPLQNFVPLILRAFFVFFPQRIVIG